MKKSDTLIYSLSKAMLIFLYLYYSVILVCGGIVAIIIACRLTQNVDYRQIIKMAFVVSIAVSGMLCSMQYIKRLYKACITERIEHNEDTIKCIGNFIYFISF